MNNLRKPNRKWLLRYILLIYSFSMTAKVSSKHFGRKFVVDVITKR